MDGAKRLQPAWSPPTNNLSESLPQLKLYNSLTSQKELFIPQNGRQVSWYGCGPTVYDVSHMGHARTYISFDILRRVLESYFGYEVKYVMNITDIDDKIIKRARQNHLLDAFVAQSGARDAADVLQDISSAVEALQDKMLREADPDKKAMHERELAKVRLAMSAHSESASPDLAALIQVCADPLAAWLDGRLGHGVNDNRIFEDLPRRFEAEYFRDMDALNILRPNVLTRVSEFVPQIVDFVTTIIDKGLAYESQGSVYFDVAKFDASPDHFYAKLMPSAVGDEARMLEGEGDLSVGAERLREKRSSKDFVLWKASKPGEPSWPSPWGAGRPGWHIECSAMASAELGESMDVHTGGVDLKFPHHDNELAQSEAFHGHSHWVRYFLHAGHLTIAGCKMSKSLKNFITIRAVLERHSSRRLRLAFLLHSWKDTLDYSEDTMAEAVGYEKLCQDFFFSVQYYVRHGAALAEEEAEEERALGEKVTACEAAVDAALLDSVDTRSALLALQGLVADGNAYVARQLAARRPVHARQLQAAARLVTRLMRVFGAAPDSEEDIGFEPLRFTRAAELRALLSRFVADVRAAAPDHDVLAELVTALEADEAPRWTRFAQQQQVDEPGAVRALLEDVAGVRTRVRAAAREHRLTHVLQVCDTLRDDGLAELGVRLEDREEGWPAAVDLADAAVLREEREQRLAKDMERAQLKAAAKEQAARAAADKEAKYGVPPSELFRQEPDKYSQFDARGMPACDAAGKELSKGLLKKLAKLMDTHEKKHAEWLQKRAAAS